MLAGRPYYDPDKSTDYARPGRRWIFRSLSGAGLFGSQLVKAAADRGQEIDFAVFFDWIGQATDPHPVSYTHLTLPTILRV